VKPLVFGSFFSPTKKRIHSDSENVEHKVRLHRLSAEDDYHPNIQFIVEAPTPSPASTPREEKRGKSAA
jgi:hypothetical protein